jgi:transaldolase
MVIFLDGPTLKEVEELNNIVGGFTTNPSLLCKAGVTNYEDFAKSILQITNKPVAFEVLSDDWREMERQVYKIISWGKNVNVKIPITNSGGQSSIPLITDFLNQGVNVNVTAVTTVKQVTRLLPAFYKAKRGYLSVFAGRIADTGIDPCPIMQKVVYLLKEVPIQLIWASAREVYNTVQAESAGCHIITLSVELFRKYQKMGRDLNDVSLDTVKMFFEAGKNFQL